MSEGFPTLAEALDAAAEEMGLAEPVAPEAGLPPAEAESVAPIDDANARVELEQPEAGTEVGSLLDTLKEEAPQAGDTSPQVGSPEFWATEVEVEIDGAPHRMTLDDMRKGTMMRSDYTRKTQELARERQVVSEAVEFHTAFRADPAGFARFVAEKAGLIAEGSAPAKAGVKLYADSDIEALVTERLTKALEEHPDVVAARQTKAASTETQAFAAIEKEYRTTLSDEHRAMIRDEAKRTGTTDLRLVFDALLLRAAQRAQARAAVKQTAPAKSGGTPVLEVPAESQVSSLADALALAEKQLSGTVA